MSSETNSIHEPEPGDQVLVAIPGSTQRQIWGFLISNESARPGELWVIFDVLVTPAPENEHYQANSVLRITRDKIIQVIKKDKRNPVIQVRTTPEGEIIDIRRIDGKTESIVVQVDDAGLSSIYRVDHTGWKEME